MLTVDPGRPLAGHGGGVAGRAQDRGGAAERRPDRKSPARKTAAGQTTIQLGDAGRDLFRGARRRWRRVGKTLLDQRAEIGERGGGCGHDGGRNVSRTKTESKKWSGPIGPDDRRTVRDE